MNFDARAGLRQRWNDLNSNLWFLPAVITIAFAILGVAMVAIDWWLWDHGSSVNGSSLFRGGVDGSRGVLTAIAGSLISAAAVVFSITVVTLQLASSQFTPRLLRRFTGDTQFQVTLGLLLGTFVYCLIALWSVGSQASNRASFVPTITTALAFVLGITSVAVLILFIHRVSRLIQVSVLVNEVTQETLALISTTYSDPDAERVEYAAAPEFPGQPGALIPARVSGYLRSIDTNGLMNLVDDYKATVVLDHRVGEFVLRGSEMARVYPGDLLDDELIGRIQGKMVIDSDRSSVEDVTLGVQQVADIGIKALSPGINDPTTALACIDSLCEILAEVSHRQPPGVVEQGQHGGLLVFRDAPRFDTLVDQAFTQIRQYGATDVIVAEYLVQQLGALALVAPFDKQLVLRQHAVLVADNACSVLSVDADCERIRNAAAWATEPADVGSPPSR